MPDPIWLSLQAPFAAFRWMQAGAYRATSPVMPPSAAWGLLLNLAGIETRDDQGAVSTSTRADAPPLSLALGVPTRRDDLAQPAVATLYQQLHAYPVGTDAAKEFKEGAQGTKYSITPGRREFLVDFRCVVGAIGLDDDVGDRIRKGLAGDLAGSRYGLPFAGDNNLLFDRIDECTEAPECHWYERIDGSGRPREGSCRLTIGIDRQESSKTTIGIFAPTRVATSAPPDAAWTWVPRQPE